MFTCELNRFGGTPQISEGSSFSNQATANFKLSHGQYPAGGAGRNRPLADLKQATLHARLTRNLMGIRMARTHIPNSAGSLRLALFQSAAPAFPRAGAAFLEATPVTSR